MVAENYVYVIGVGDLDIDIYLQLDHIPGQDEKVLAEKVELHPGGMVANFLACLQRLGTDSIFHGPVGNDEYGKLALADLESNGVDISGAIVKEGEKTYFCVVMLDGSGEKSLIVAPSGCLFPTPSDVSGDLIATATHLHTTAADGQTALKALTLAKQHGLTTSLDLESTMVRDKGVLLRLLTNVDLLFVNQHAATALMQSNDIETAAVDILSMGPAVVCVTMGADGSLVAIPGEAFFTRAFPVEVVDSTGAGDCFAAGFVHGFLQEWPLSKTARFASAVAAISIQYRGGHAGAPTQKEVESFLHMWDSHGTN